MAFEKVLVGMSGGVDSSVAASELRDNGYEVSGVTLLLCESDNESSVSDAKAVCDRMGIEHHTVNLKTKFSHYVMDNFIDEYKAGNTPNPCIVCNKHIKFGAMLDTAVSMGFDKIATGHYARIRQDNNGRYLLYKALDEAKDQSYVLYNLSQYQLSHVLFPLGELTKAEVREKAVSQGFVNADRPDSQDICFVPDGDYAGFIERKDGFVSKEGNYTDINGNILGEHKGIIHYTLGQRKGLGIALGKPQFVIDKNVSTNNVILGDEEHLFKKEVLVYNPNFIPFDSLEKEISVTAKLRYRHKPAKALLVPCGDNTVKLIFDEPQRAPSPGQAAVFYDGEMVIGGGTIK